MGENSMENENLKAKLEEAMRDEAFVAMLGEAVTPEEAQKLFASKGIEFSLEEVKAIAKSLQVKAENSELSEDDLEAVSGGYFSTIAIAVGPLAMIASHIARKWKW